jgi:tetratricopeptide (TPR) repeat protein
MLVITFNKNSIMKSSLLAIAFLFGSTVALVAQTADQLYEEGLKLRDQKKANEALEKFKQATILKPDYTEAFYMIGWCQNDTKNYTGAIETLRKVRLQWSTIPKVYFELGYAFEKNLQKDSAKISYLKCTDLKKDYALAWKQLGYLSYDADDYTAAMDYFAKYESSAKSEINDYQYWYRKGFVHNATKQYDSAKLCLTKSLSFKKDYTNTYLEMGFACTKLKQNDEAIGYFNQAMALDPKSHIPYNGIGEVYRDNKKDCALAMEWYRKTLSINQNEKKANFGIGYCLNSEGKYQEAIPYLKRAIASQNNYAAAYVDLGYSYFKTNNPSEAIIQFDKAISFNPKNENARYYKGLVYINLKDKMNAQKMADELKGLGSNNTASLQERINKM